MNQVFGFFTSNYTWMLGIIITILLAIIGSYAEKTNFGQGKLPDDTLEDEEPDEELMENFKIRKVQLDKNAKNKKKIDNYIVNRPIAKNGDNQQTSAQTDYVQAKIREAAQRSAKNDASAQQPQNGGYIVDKEVADKITQPDGNYVILPSNANIVNVPAGDYVLMPANGENKGGATVTVGGYAPNYDSKFDYNYDKMSNEVEEFLPKKSVIDSDLLDEIDGLSLDKTQKFKFDDLFGLDDLELPEIKGLESDDDEDIWKF